MQSLNAEGPSLRVMAEKEDEALVAGRQSQSLSLFQQRNSNTSVVSMQSWSAHSAGLDQARLRDPDLCVAELNKRYAVVNCGNQVMIADDFNATHPFLTEKAFHGLYANAMVTVGGREQSVSRLWFSHPDRRQYTEGTVFDPGGSSPAEYYNLWKGFAVKADPRGSCQLFLDHVRDVICNGDADCHEYVLSWLALMIQRPERLPGVALCLLSGQGTGKGEFVKYLGKIIGRYLKHLTNRGQIFGQFTEHLDDALLVFADEMHWGGSKDETGLLKGLITEESRSSERKYGAVMAVSNCIHLIIASNEEWAIPAEIDDRRFFVLEVSDHRVGDFAYFERLAAERDNGGPEALLAYLQTRDINAFNTRDFPRTRARLLQQLESLKPIDRWVFELASSAQFPLSVVGDGDPWPLKVPKEELYQAYMACRNETRAKGSVESKRALTQALARFGFAATKGQHPAGGRRVQAYEVPSIEGLRSNIDRLLGYPTDWEPL
ncbi:DUF5906 domain-containing protein [Haliea salexigens]|uniref:DUF5906 domain-containing protein n=1 Tax=Haliea salexigens TaxID=287487 RepID=UPI000405E446|nr:DUF5906 domain-containing protein [Haliea salexigens]